MRYGRRLRVIPTVLFAALAIPFTGLAQEPDQKQAQKHKHYTLVDLGTLGGPNSFLNGGSRLIDASGAVAGTADTSIYDSGCDCYVDHAFKWQNGVMTDLGALPGGAGSLANSINSGGAVAGWSNNGLIDPVSGLPAVVGTTWKHGQITDLGTLGGSFSGAIGINDRGQAAGFAGNTIPDPDGFSTLLFGFGAIPTTQWHAARWQTNGTIEDLGTLGGPASFAIYVNERGQVAGLSYTNSVPNPATGMPTVAPFIWENGQMTNLGSFGGTNAATAGLNNRGQVVGTSDLTGDLPLHPHAFLWTRGTMQDLGTLGGTFSSAWGLNEKGEVIGLSTPTADFPPVKGFLWRNGAMTDLGSLADDGCSNAESINAKGQIVGQSFPCDETTSHPYIWENGGPMVDLNTLILPGSDLQLYEPLFISDQGEIAGFAFLPSGDAHAVVLIPKKGDDHSMESATVAPPIEAASAVRSTADVTRAALSPEMSAALRARLTNQRRGFGLGLPRRTH